MTEDQKILTMKVAEEGKNIIMQLLLQVRKES